MRRFRRGYYVDVRVSTNTTDLQLLLEAAVPVPLPHFDIPVSQTISRSKPKLQVQDYCAQVYKPGPMETPDGDGARGTICTEFNE